jgi:hypothetical protein
MENIYKKHDLVTVTDDGKDRNGMVIMQDGATPYVSYVVLMQDTGEQEQFHVNKLRPHASDYMIAMGIIRRLEKIQRLREQITEELEGIENLMRLDGQPSYELDAVKGMRTVHRSAMRYELSFMQTAWTGYAMERKTKR